MTIFQFMSIATAPAGLFLTLICLIAMFHPEIKIRKPFLFLLLFFIGWALIAFSMWTWGWISV